MGYIYPLVVKVELSSYLYLLQGLLFGQFLVSRQNLSVTIVPTVVIFSSFDEVPVSFGIMTADSEFRISNSATLVVHRTATCY